MDKMKGIAFKFSSDLSMISMLFIFISLLLQVLATFCEGNPGSAICMVADDAADSSKKDTKDLADKMTKLRYSSVIMIIIAVILLGIFIFTGADSKR